MIKYNKHFKRFNEISNKSFDDISEFSETELKLYNLFSTKECYNCKRTKRLYLFTETGKPNGGSVYLTECFKCRKKKNEYELVMSVLKDMGVS